MRTAWEITTIQYYGKLPPPYAQTATALPPKRESPPGNRIRGSLLSAVARCQKNPRFGRSWAAASMISAAVVSVSAASAAFACSVG